MSQFGTGFVLVILRRSMIGFHEQWIAKMAMHQITKRLNRIFENLLGCELEYQSIGDVSLADWQAGDLAEMLGHASTPRLGHASTAPLYIACRSTDSFGFPVWRENQLIGLAIVHHLKDPSPQRLMRLADLMSMVLDYGIRAGDRSEKLRIIEERLAQFDAASNVILLRPARFERVLRVTESNRTSVGSKSPASSLMSPLLATPLLLISPSSACLNRVAIEIHQLSKRWAFVNSEDLPNEIFDSREALEELGGLTLFIQDIAMLTTNQQLKLAEYLARAASDETPHIIAGSIASVDELVHQGRILPHLSRLFTVSTLNTLNRASASQIATDLVNASVQHLVAITKTEVTESHKVGENFIPFNPQYFHPDDTSTRH